MRLLQASTLCLSVFVLAACKRSTEPTVYTVPKEEASISPNSAQAAPALAGDMASSSFTPPVASNGGHAPTWEVPSHWVISAGSAMRKASYAVEHSEGTLDVAVTSFPGDVGGPLANVNRWLRQIGLSPITEAELDTFYAPLGGKEPGHYSELIGTEQSTLAATFLHDGNSWFFKMTGPTVAIQDERDAFLAVVRDLHFLGH